MNDNWEAIVIISGFSEDYKIQEGDSEYMQASVHIPYEIGVGINDGDEITIRFGEVLISSIAFEKEFNINESIIIVRTIINNIEK